MRHIEIPVVKHVEEIVQPIIHFVFEVHQAGVVKWNPDVAGKCGSGIFTHWSESKLQFLRLSELRIKQNWWFCCFCIRVLHLEKKCSEKQQVHGNYFEVDGLSAFGEKLPGASLVTMAFASHWSDRHFFFTSVCSSW
jgi:hypothetical protein